MSSISMLGLDLSFMQDKPKKPVPIKSFKKVEIKRAPTLLRKKKGNKK